MNRHSSSAAAMAALLSVSAVNHFRNPKFYNAVVPRSISTDTDGQYGVLTRRQWTHLSGVLEFAAAAGLLLPATRRAAATGTTLMYIAFIAGHLSALQRAFGPRGSDRQKAIHLARLPLQLPLIRWAWSLRG
ncbi:DoxX family protein [Arthrobacter sp. APC 3897]|uniref:DoxX family protein n=1 Tax=Arthrobacter sp. APC 3897 TaxID=3035204 RepID=UPI0025B61E54|nr:DoxX family protein [Arthrobacter sp. APC 3897]MDN3481360.1 DoxX family protein [Arthrobacter sp. APC 3897]